MAPVVAKSILRSVRCCTGMCQVVKPVIQVVELYTFFVFTFLVLPLILFLLLRPSHSSRTPELACAVTAAMVQGVRLNPLRSLFVLQTLPM
jgi:hypothetical protein